MADVPDGRHRPDLRTVHHFKRAAKEKVYGINGTGTMPQTYGVLMAPRRFALFAAASLDCGFRHAAWVFRHDWQEVDLASPNVKRCMTSLCPIGVERTTSRITGPRGSALPRPGSRRRWPAYSPSTVPFSYRLPGKARWASNQVPTLGRWAT